MRVMLFPALLITLAAASPAPTDRVDPPIDSSTSADPLLATNPWTEITDKDLDEIQTLIQENHPGPLASEYPYFAEWMKEGFAQAKQNAAKAKSFRDYKRTLRTYLTGFREGHLRVNLLVDYTQQEWPGFLPRLDHDGTVRVGVSSLPNVKQNERIVSCDGQTIQSLFDQRVAPVWWNKDIPSQRFLHFPRTLLIDRDDADARLKSCVLDGGSGPRTVKLEWRFLAAAESLQMRQRALGTTQPELGLRKVDGVWFLSMPSFNYWGSDSVANFRALRAEVAANLDDIRKGPLVIDVRGNLGGISSWADDVISTIWSREWVKSIESRFDDVADWRASPANLARIDALIKRMEGDKLDTSELAQVRTVISEALAKGQPLARQPGTETVDLPTPKKNPFPGRAYLLTDYWCESACLDFADMVLRLPHVTHIGQPTNADSVFIDADNATLPSNLASLTYSNKIYRKRLRANNEGYTPKYLWATGQMTFEALAAWVKQLPERFTR